MADVAILQSYDSRWAINDQRHNRNFDPVGLLLSYYKPLREILQQVDVVSPAAPLAQYRMVVAPGLNVLSDDVAQPPDRLCEWRRPPSAGTALGHERHL